MDPEQIKRTIKKTKKIMLHEAKNLQENALKVTLKTVGEGALVTAKSYCNLGRLYQSQQKYKVIFLNLRMYHFEMHLTAVFNVFTAL